MSTTTVDRILVGQATLSTPIVDVKRSVFQVSGSSERYGYRVKKVADPPERETLNLADSHFSQCYGSTCERGTM